MNGTLPCSLLIQQCVFKVHSYCSVSITSSCPWASLVCIYYLYLLIHQCWTSTLLLTSHYHKQHCREHPCTCFLPDKCGNLGRKYTQEQLLSRRVCTHLIWVNSARLQEQHHLLSNFPPAMCENSYTHTHIHAQTHVFTIIYLNQLLIFAF